MPCAVSKDEKEYYEKESNFERFGVRDFSHRITETVACELANTLTDLQFVTLSKMAQKWIRLHAEKDRKRKTDGR